VSLRKWLIEVLKVADISLDIFYKYETLAADLFAIFSLVIEAGTDDKRNLCWNSISLSSSNRN
jgi:hypothetical protein